MNCCQRERETTCLSVDLVRGDRTGSKRAKRVAGKYGYTSTETENQPPRAEASTRRFEAGAEPAASAHGESSRPETGEFRRLFRRA